MGFLLSDFHTDLLSSHLTAAECDEYLSENTGVSACLAVFTRNDESPKPQIEKYRHMKTNRRHRIAFENIHFAVTCGIKEVAATSPIYCSLTWNDDNQLAGGACGNSPLTKKGREIALALSESGIHVDCAHLSRQSFYDLCDLGVPLVNSHTCFNDVVPHRRNIERGQIELILQSGGLIGLTLVGEFLSPCGTASIDDVVRHIDYFCENFDSDRLALGTDFFGTDNLPENLKSYKMQVNLVEKLLKIGYNVNVVENIMHGNLNRFIHKREVFND